MSYKFTNYQRDAFIRSVLNETPQIDYDTLIRNRLQEILVAKVDNKLQAIYKDKELRKHLGLSYVSFNGAKYFSAKLYFVDGEFSLKMLSKEEQEEIHKLLADYKDQDTDRNKLKEKLRGVIYSYTSIKKAHECMPEFAKYLPQYSKPESKQFYAPAINDLVTDLVKAGWPDKKGNKNASK